MKRLVIIIGVVFVGLLLGLLGASSFISHRQSSLLTGLPQHGTSFLLEYDPSQLQGNTNVVETLKEVMRKRFFRIGVRIFWEPLSSNQIRMTAPIEVEKDVEATKNYISRGGRLEFRLVYPDNGQRLQAIDAGTEVIPPGYNIEVYKPHSDGGKRPQEERLLVKKETGLGGEHVTDAHAGHGKEGWEVGLNFDSEGTALLDKITEAHVNHRLAIVLDGVIQSAPNIREPIFGGSARISGKFGEQEARSLASVLENPLPFPIRIIESKTF